MLKKIFKPFIYFFKNIVYCKIIKNIFKFLKFYFNKLKTNKKVRIISICVLSVIIISVSLSIILTHTLQNRLLFEKNGTGYSVYAGKYYDEENVVIPSTYKGLPVNTIKDSAFSQNKNLKTIEIPNSITTIGIYAFNNCSSLTSIEIPNSVTKIGIKAFRSCESLQKITIPFVGNMLNGTEDTHFGYIFGEGDFYSNSTRIPESLKEVIIGGGCIDNHAFYNCKNIEDIIIQNNVTSIGSSAFNNCSSLTSVNIPDSVTIIESYAFNNCSSLTSVTIPDSVISIGSYAFNNCSSLTSVNIPDSVTSIGSYAFNNCSSLTSVNIPNTIETIWSSSFYNCNSLQYNKYDNALYLGNDSNPHLLLAKASALDITNCNVNQSCKMILDYAFYKCYKLALVSIPDSVIYIYSSTFSNCPNLLYNKPSTYDNGLYLGNTNKYLWLMDMKYDSITSYAINFNCKYIRGYAFYGCSNLTTVYLPSSIDFIGNYAFDACSRLVDFNYAGTVAQWNEIRKESNWKGNALFNTIHCSDGDIYI